MPKVKKMILLIKSVISRIVEINKPTGKTLGITFEIDNASCYSVNGGSGASKGDGGRDAEEQSTDDPNSSS